MEDNKKQLVKKLGEIKNQLNYLKHQEDILNMEYENIMLELWELLPITEEKENESEKREFRRS